MKEGSDYRILTLGYFKGKVTTAWDLTAIFRTGHEVCLPRRVMNNIGTMLKRGPGYKYGGLVFSLARTGSRTQMDARFKRPDF